MRKYSALAKTLLFHLQKQNDFPSPQPPSQEKEGLQKLEEMQFTDQASLCNRKKNLPSYLGSELASNIGVGTS